MTKKTKGPTRFTVSFTNAVEEFEKYLRTISLRNSVIFIDSFLASMLDLESNNNSQKKFSTLQVPEHIREGADWYLVTSISTPQFRYTFPQQSSGCTSYFIDVDINIATILGSSNKI